MGHEEVVRHRIRSEMGDIAKRKGAESIGIRQLVDLPTDAPRVTVATDRRVFFCDRCIGCDVAVQIIVG